MIAIEMKNFIFMDFPDLNIINKLVHMTKMKGIMKKTNSFEGDVVQSVGI